MNEMQIFESPEFGAVRVQETNGEVWFCLVDVCRVLEIKNARDVKKRLNEKGVDSIYTLTSRGNQEMTFINEPNLYKVIFQSRKDEAERFTDWVTSEVLPSIRKHGVYAVDQVLHNPDMLIAALTELKAERAKAQALTQTVAAQQAQLEQDKPKVIFADAVAASEDTVLMRDLATTLRKNGVDIGQNRLFAWMRENHYLCAAKGSRYNTPTQRAMDMGLFDPKPTIVTRADGQSIIKYTPKVTGKGQQYFINRFLNQRIALCNERGAL